MPHAMDGASIKGGYLGTSSSWRGGVTARQDVLRLAPGEVLFREGDIGDQAYLIESGVLEVYVDRPNATHVIGHLGLNDLVGEMALISYGPRSASVRAIAPATLRTVTQESLQEQLDRTPPMVRHLLRVILRRSRNVLAHIEGTTAPAPQDRLGVLENDATEASDQDITVNRLRIRQAVREAMQRDELELFYQPIVRLADTRQIVGFEALVRWRREGTLVPPGEFIWVIEDSNLIVEFGRWAIRQATAALRQLQDQVRRQGGTQLPFCSVNLSVRQFNDPELIATIRGALAANEVPPSSLHLEITETAVLHNLDAALDLLNRCRDLGCKLIVDDFGTGYSSLSYLHRLPVAAFKLDRSFIQDSATSDRGLPIIRAVARLAEDLGMYVVAEGIETSEQAALCHSVGVAYAQGFLFGHAKPLDSALTQLGTAPPIQR